MSTALQDKKIQQNLIRLLFEDVWNDGKMDFIEEIFSPEVIIHVGEQEFIGKDTWKEVIHTWRTAFPDMKYQVLQTVHADDKVVCHWRAAGTHLGIFLGMFPTKRKAAYEGMTIFSIKHGKFQEAWVSSDVSKLLDELRIFSNKKYTPKEFSIDVSGPAEKIYQWILQARATPSCKQKLANALRDQFAFGPPDNEPALDVPKELFEDLFVHETFIPGKNGHQIRALIYSPKNITTALPILVYFHGGGWSIGSPETSDLFTRKLSLLSNSIIISVDYRLAPEFPFPAALEDGLAFYLWARNNALKLHGNPEKIAVGGDSSGGNLALALSLMLRDEKLRAPDAILAICPLTDFFFEKYPSALTNGPKGLIYDYSFLSFVRSIYASFEDLDSPYVSPMYADLKKLPPTFVLTAGQDLLFDENKIFIERLKESKVPVEFLIHKEMPHAYYHFLGLSQEEEIACKAMSQFLQKHLKN